MYATQSGFDFQNHNDIIIDKNKWDFPSKNTLNSTHGCHTYVAAMNPHLAKMLLIKLVPPGGNVLDPFVGGGAVMVEALNNDIPGCGIDVNPLAALISKVKTTYIHKSTLLREYNRIIDAFSSNNVDPWNFPKNYKIDFWFKPYMILPLSKLANLIGVIEDENVKDVFRLIFSSTIRDVSLTYRGEIRLRRLQGDDYERFNPDVLMKFKERAESTIHRVSNLPKKHIIQVKIGNAMKMEFENNQFSTIICSPPYGDDRNGVGYFQFSKNMLFWLGLTYEQLQQNKDMFLGGVKNNKYPPESETLEMTIEQIKENPVPSNLKAVEECISFYHDYQIALQEMARVCSGKIAIVIGNRTLSQTHIDNAKITTELLGNIGYSLEKYYYREINKKRIPVMQPGGGQRDRSGGGLINKEHTLIYGPVK